VRASKELVVPEMCPAPAKEKLLLLLLIWEYSKREATPGDRDNKFRLKSHPFHSPRLDGFHCFVSMGRLTPGILTTSLTDKYVT
jgi:hypothetical protein